MREVIAPVKDVEVYLKTLKKPDLKALVLTQLDVHLDSNVKKADLVQILLDAIQNEKVTLDEIARGLANLNPSTPTTQLLDVWFMKPLKTHAISVGRVNEERVKSQFLAVFLNRHGLELVRIKNIGLAVNEAVSERFATSVDGVVVYRESQSNFLKFALLEVKTRSGSEAIKKVTYIAKTMGSYIKTNSREEDFLRAVPDKSYRLQLLHHAAVMNVLEVFYVESTVHQIHYIVQVTFSREDLQKYVNGMIRPLLRLHVEPDR